MRYRTAGTFVAAALLTSIASAQSMAPQAAEHSSTNAVVKNTTVHTTTAPARGANSFTEGQAQSRIMKAGYTHVSGLTKDDAGLWQGTALRHGAKVHVALDYKGNVSRK